MLRDVLIAGAYGAAASVALLALQPFLKRRRVRDQYRERIRDIQTLYKLKNSNGMEVHIIPVGCAIQRLIVPDKNGKLDDVVLGCDDVISYLDGSSPYFGAIVGRCANRISNASFSIRGKIAKLAANAGTASLHGGIQGFDKAVWKCKDGVVETKLGHSITFTHVSPSGDEGYPGTVEATVTYTLTSDSNQLITEMSATTTEDTIINLAQHSYFNLSGHKSGNVLDHVLKIYGDHYTPLGEDMVTTGEILPVRGTPLDFTSQKDIGLHIASLPGGYDHNYILHSMGPLARFVVKNGMYSTSPKLAASVFDPASGRCMDVKTTAPAMQFYTGNFLNGVKGKDGGRYMKHSGFCLETQGFPDAVNKPNFPSVVLKPGETYKHVLVYRFYSA
mmetsp:Transcript_6535/g.18223  ORF Transcript_6535/g.18223 Transcript_6535/m.18223 type:complete len:389 (+) Transcript_6535:81-1247(+)